MFHIPTMPAWPHLHPILVHLPIGAAVLAPLLMFVGLFPSRAAGMRWAALLLLVCGTVGCFLAIESGEAASDVNEVGMIDGADKVVTEHEELAERTLLIFIPLTVVYGGGLVTQHFWERARRKTPHFVFHGLTLLIALFGSLTLANVGHLGGLLVHQYGVRASILP